MDDVTAATPAASATAPPRGRTTRSARPSQTAPLVRPLRADDEPHVRRIFRETVALGAPVVLPPRELRAYEQLCLGWYLAHPADSLVVEEDGAVRGYLLACLDHDAQARWQRRRALRWGTGALARVTTGLARGDARRFVLHRIHDGLATVLDGPAPPHRAHAHVNLDPQLRGVAVGHTLVAAMDRMVTDTGLDGWFGEMNWPASQSLDAVERAGALVVHRQRNHTLSWLAGQPVDRATVARPLDRATDSAARRARRTTGGAA